MSECTCNPDQGRYLLLAFEHAADMQAEVNRLMSLQIRPSWRLHGPTFFANAGYRQAMSRVPVNDVDALSALAAVLFVLVDGRPEHCECVEAIRRVLRRV